MPTGSRLTVRLSPALEGLLSDRVRQGARVSDIVREALEAYLGLCQTQRQMRDTVSSDTVSDVSAIVSAIASDMADIQRRLLQIETQMAALAAMRPRPTPRPPTPTAMAPQGDAVSFDPTMHRLGRLCPRGHDYQGTGQSLRKASSSGACLACEREQTRERRQAHREQRQGG